MKNNKLNKFSFQVFIILIVIAIATVTYSVYYFNGYSKNYKSEINKQLTAISELKINNITQWRNERLNDAEIFHNNKQIQSIVQSILTDTNNAEAKNLLKNMFNYIMSDDEYRNIMLIDTSGKVLYSYVYNKTHLATNYRNDITKLKYSNDIHFNDFEKEMLSDSICITLLVPVLNNNEQLIAEIKLCINPNHYLFPIVKFFPYKSKTAETLIVRSDGNYVTYLNNLRFIKNSAFNLHIPIKNKTIPSVMTVLGKEGIVEGTDYFNNKVVAYVNSIKGTPWYLVSKINIDEAYAPINNRLWEIIVVITIIIFCFCLLSFYLWKRQQYQFYKINHQSVMALLDSEKRYKAIFEGAGEGIVYHLLNGKIIECNKNFAKIHGYTIKEIVDINIHDLNSPESEKLVKQRIENILKNKTFVFESEHKHKNGRIIPLEVVSATINLNGEKIIVSFQHDITERKIAENNIKKLNRIYAFISNINKTIVRVKNKNELYSNICKVAVDVGKFKMAWIGEINKNKVEVISYAGDTGNYLERINIDLNDKTLSKGPTARAIKTGFYAFSNNIQNDNAMLPWVEEAVKLGFNSSIALPIIVFEKTIGTLNLYSSEINFFVQEEINLLIEVSNDISFAVEYIENEKLYKNTELNLIKSEKKYRLLAENSTDIIWSIDLQSLKFIYISPSVTRILGYTTEEAINMTIEQYLTPESFQFIMKELKEAIKLDSLKKLPPDEIRTYEVKEFCKNGSIIDVEIKVKFVRGTNGNPYAIQGTTSDITERKKFEAEIEKLNQTLELKVIERTKQLQAANKELDAFSYSVSHNLHTPLRLIKGFSGILNQKYDKIIDDDGKHILDTISNNAQNMEKLIDSLLNLSKTTRSDLRKIEVDMNKIMNIVINETLLPGQQNGYKITICNLPVITADAELIKQVWINLVSNAIKYTRPKKERIIEIGAYEKINENVYYVKDNGVGFNPEYSDKLFGVFQRLHKSEDFEGIGVGLAIVQRIINKHGGKVWAEGKLNEGAAFWFSLPK